MRSRVMSEGGNSAARIVVIDTAAAKPGVFRGGSRFAVLVAAIAMLAGCSAYKPYIPESEGHIPKPKPKPEAEKAIPPPARVSTFVPPPKPAIKPQTYTVVVNEVQVKDLLLALARDTKQNIDIHPGLAGLVSLNAINETLPAILERISKQVNMRYHVEGKTIIVSPDVSYVKTYRIGYVNMVRDTTSTIGVTGELVAGGTASGTASASSGTSGSSTIVRTTSRNDFWEQLRDNIRSILNSTRMQSLDAQARAERLALVKQEQELRAKQMEAASRAGQGAPNLASSVIAATGGSQRTSLLPDDVIVNPISGTVTINATEKQHRLVQQHIDSIVTSMQRQVLIEATIVEVQLSNNFQAGIDWQRLSESGSFQFTQSLLGGNLTSPPFFAATYGVDQFGNRSGSFVAEIALLEQFGNTRVLSSPKLMALNNQTALLKVVDNVVYFEVSAQTSQAQTTSLTTFDTTAKTVAVGVVMGVTPQITDDSRVSLTVRPTISRVTRFVNDPNPSLAAAGVTNPVPEVQTREMESVLQVGNGQTVILGGLMQDETRRDRDQIPGLGNVPDVGDLFAFRDEEVAKSELVIFLRTTIVPNPSLESDELKFFQRFLPQPEPKPDLSKVPRELRPPNQREQKPTDPAGTAQ